jgi:hypothetical protein
MVALKYVTPAQINPRDMADRFRRAAEILDLGTWEAIFVGGSVARSAAIDLASFCDAATEMGSAPCFHEALEAVHSALNREGGE